MGQVQKAGRYLSSDQASEDCIFTGTMVPSGDKVRVGCTF